MIITYPPETWTWRLAWDTSIVEGYDGLEQRAALRLIPTVEYEAEYLLDLADLREVRTALFSDPTATHELALWQWETRVTTSGTNTVTVPAKDSETIAVVGGRFVLQTPGVADLVVTVSVVGGGIPDYILTTGQNVSAFNGKPTTMLPLAEVYLRDNLQTGRYRKDEVGRWNLSAVSKTRYAALGIDSDDVPEYDAMLLLDITPSIEEKLQEQHQAGVGGLDDGDDSVRVPITGMVQGNIAREARFSWHTSAQRQFWLSFLFTVVGRLRPFLFPTWRPDLDLLRPVADDTNELLVADSPYFPSWWAAQSHKRLALMFADGTFESVTVVEYTDHLDGTITLVIQDDVVSVEEPTYISFLEIVRLADDKVEFDVAGETAHFDLPLVVVQVAPPA